MKGSCSFLSQSLFAVRVQLSIAILNVPLISCTIFYSSYAILSSTILMDECFHSLRAGNYKVNFTYCLHPTICRSHLFCLSKKMYHNNISLLTAMRTMKNYFPGWTNQNMSRELGQYHAGSVSECFLRNTSYQTVVAPVNIEVINAPLLSLRQKFFPFVFLKQYLSRQFCGRQMLKSLSKQLQSDI